LDICKNKIDFKNIIHNNDMILSGGVYIDSEDILNEKCAGIYEYVIEKYYQPYDDDCVIRSEFKDISFELFTDFDGCDSNGPESHLYDLRVKWKNKNNMEFTQVWHREYWFRGEDTDKFMLVNY